MAWLLFDMYCILYTPLSQPSFNIRAMYKFYLQTFTEICRSMLIYIFCMISTSTDKHQSDVRAQESSSYQNYELDNINYEYLRIKLAKCTLKFPKRRRSNLFDAVGTQVIFRLFSYILAIIFIWSMKSKTTIIFPRVRHFLWNWFPIQCTRTCYQHKHPISTVLILFGVSGFGSGVKLSAEHPKFHSAGSLLIYFNVCIRISWECYVFVVVGVIHLV